MSDRPLTLLLIDGDAVFRLGLVTALLNQPAFSVLAQVASLAEAQPLLQTNPPDIIILDPLRPSDLQAGWPLCWYLRRYYPPVKLCLLTASLEYDQLLRAKQLGIEGYFPKGTAIADILAGLGQIGRGETVWSSLQDKDLGRLAPAQQWLWRWFHSGLGQIEAQLNSLETEKQAPHLSAFDHVFLQGRQRELRTAQWFVQKLMPRALRRLHQAQTLQAVTNFSLTAQSEGEPSPRASLLPISANLSSPPAPLVLNVQNLTPMPLALDALTPEQSQHLLSLTWQKFQTVLADLKTLNISPEQLPQHHTAVLTEIWQGVTLHFLGSQGNHQAEFNLERLQGVLESYKPIIQTESLQKIPCSEQVLARWLAEDATADLGAELTLYQDHLILQLANAVMVFVLNYFSTSEALKTILYRPQLLSSREIARFRNNLAWHYQLTHYRLEPKNIFESQYQLLYFTPQGIALKSVYAPRQQELEQLQGLRWLVTLILEIRDATSPRLQAIVRFLGKGLVFALTQVLGRAVGLIIKGVLQGVGNTWQETRYGPRPKRESEFY